MPVETTYSALREKLASYLDQVTDDREVVIVRRRSPKNAERLLRALHRATRGEGKAETVEDLRRSVGQDPLG